MLYYCIDCTHCNKLFNMNIILLHAKTVACMLAMTHDRLNIMHSVTKGPIVRAGVSEVKI